MSDTSSIIGIAVFGEMKRVSKGMENGGGRMEDGGWKSNER